MTLRKLLTVLVLVIGTATVAQGKGKKRAGAEDPTAQAVEQARQEATGDSEELKDLLGNSKLVAKGETQKSEDASEASSAVMAGTESAASTDTDVTGDIADPSTQEALNSAGPIEAEEPKQDISKLNENEIPVLTKETKKAQTSGNVVQKAVISIGLLLVMGVFAFLGIKRWSKRSQTRAQNTRIKVLTQHFIGPKKSVAIIQVAGESILVGVTDHSITMLKTLSLLDEEIPEDTPRNFNSAMNGYEGEDEEEEEVIREIPKRGRRAQGRDEEDFAMRGISEIRDTVSRRMKGFKDL